MKRLKMTTTKLEVFLSPFVYPDKLAEEKLEELSWLVKKKTKARLEAIEIFEYPPEAVYDREEDRYSTGGSLDKKIRRLESLWYKLDRSV